MGADPGCHHDRLSDVQTKMAHVRLSFEAYLASIDRMGPVPHLLWCAKGIHPFGKSI